MAQDEESRKAFGKRLAEARAALDPKPSQDEVAKRLFEEHGIETMGKQTISAWEKGRNIPDAFTVRALARIYGRTIDSFFGDEMPSARALKLAAFYDAQSAVARQTLESLWFSFADVVRRSPEWQKNAPMRESLITMEELKKGAA